MPPAPKPTDKLDKVRHLMGTRPDHEIAEMAGSTISVVGRYRRKHGIPAYDGYKFGVGQSPPARKAEEGTGERPPKKRKGGRVYTSKLDPFKDIVGKMPDRVVAEKAGMSAEGVRMYRRRHEIPLTLESGDVPASRSGGTRRPRPSKLDPFRDLLGIVPDREVAAMAGVTSENVRAYRRKRSIPARWRGEGSAPAPATTAESTEAAAPVQPAARQASVADQGYEVEARLPTGETVRYITVARSLSEAAASSQAAVERTRKGATIVAIQHLGPALS